MLLALCRQRLCSSAFKTEHGFTRKHSVVTGTASDRSRAALLDADGCSSRLLSMLRFNKTFVDEVRFADIWSFYECDGLKSFVLGISQQHPAPTACRRNLRPLEPRQPHRKEEAYVFLDLTGLCALVFLSGHNPLETSAALSCLVWTLA